VGQAIAFLLVMALIAWIVIANNRYNKKDGGD
jgi:hypothetical protein